MADRKMRMTKCGWKSLGDKFLKLGVFLAGHSVAMVIYCVTKIIPTCSPMIGQFFDTILVASIDKCGYNDTSNSKSWNVLETALSHLK